MDREDIELLYKKFLSDNDIDKLELYINNPNIFSILGVNEQESKHSNFISWILNPKENHGLNTLFLERFIRDILIDNRNKHISIVDITDLRLDEAIIRREWKNIDILIELPEVVITIENKIFSTEHSNQLNRYKKIIDDNFKDSTKLFVYLTPLGIESSINDVYINYSYQNICHILEDIINIYQNSINKIVLLYLENYIQTIKNHIMEDGIINNLAKKIYQNHKQLLDIIIENKPDTTSEFSKFLIEKIKESKWIVGSCYKYYKGFLTPELDKIIPKGYSGGWTQKESFLFVLGIEAPKYIRIYSSISPGDEDSIKILSEILNQIPNLKKNFGEKWRTYYNENIKYDFDELMNSGEENIRIFIDKFWNKVENMVNIIEPAILAKKDLLLELNNKRDKEKK